MMVKALIICFLCISHLTTYCYSQSSNSEFEKQTYSKETKLRTKTVKILTNYPQVNRERIGSGFIINKNGDYFLVSNYHVIQGGAFSDTSLSGVDGIPIAKGGLMPNSFKIVYHTNDKDKHETQVYDIYDKRGNPLFISIPTNNNKLTYWPMEITDLVFYKIKPPKKAVIDTIDIFATSPKMNIKGNSLISIWGFRNDCNNTYQYPCVDTALTIYDSVFSITKKYILFHTYRDLGGDSGSPIYLKKGSSWEFLGIHSATAKPEDFKKYRFLKDKKYSSSVGVFISREFIRQAFNKYAD